MSDVDVYNLYRKGMALLDNGSPHAACQALTTARDAEPGKASIRVCLGRALFSTGRFADAAAEFASALAIDPVDHYAHFGLGLASHRLGDRQRARRHLKLAVAMRPTSEHYSDALARLEGEAATGT
jgi:Flp pilus assembly protein TadD